MADSFQLKAIITGVDRLSPTLGRIQRSAAAFRRQLNGMGGMSLMQGVAFAAPLVAAGHAAIEFESAMADVKKVVNFEAPQQFKKMSTDVLEMSKRLPMAATGIAAIVAAGGQAGLARGELTEFAEDAVKMGVAFDQSADQSGDMMAKWRTSFKLSQKSVVELADKINYLGNTGAASAQQISAIVTRIGPLGEVAGVASGEISALGATMASVGVEEEIAATGIKNFMLALTSGSAATKKQKAVFRALRLDAAQVSVGMQNDAKGMMVKVLNAISSIDNSKRPAVLSSLFGKESINAIAPLLTNLDLLKVNFEKVADQAKYAGSMTTEYEVRAATTANNVQLFQNRTVALAVAFGDMLLPSLNSTMGALGPLLESVSKMSQQNPVFLKTILGLGGGFLAYKMVVQGAITMTNLFTGALKTNPIGMMVMALGVLAANWDRVAAAAGNAAAKNKLALASADQAAMEGDVKTIQVEIDQVETRVNERAVARKALAIKAQTDYTGNSRDLLEQSDKQGLDDQKTLKKLNKTKKNAQIIQADEALESLPEHQRSTANASSFVQERMSDPAYKNMEAMLLKQSLTAKTAAVDRKESKSTIDVNLKAPPGYTAEAKSLDAQITVKAANVGTRSLAGG